MTDDMGYRNIDRVYRLAQHGRLSKLSNGVQTLDLLALSMMTYMARKAVDKEDVRNVIHNDKPYWCYWGGWDAMAAEMGLILPPGEFGDPNATIEELSETVEKRTRTARNRLSRTARFLQERQCLKMLKAPVTFAGKNAVWLLLLGESEEENRQAETWARECLRI